MYLLMKMKHHTVFILPKKLLKSILIYYYYQILKIPIVLIKDFDRFMTNKIKHHGNKHFVDIASIAWFSSSKVLEFLVKNCLESHKINFTS